MMNCVQLIGRLTANPELKILPSGVEVVAFSLAVGRDYKNKAGEYDTDFFRCVAYRGTAKILAKYTKKGDLIGVVGALRQNTYEKDGKRFSLVEIVGEKVQFLTKKSGTDSSGEDFDEMEPLDDIPF